MAGEWEYQYRTPDANASANPTGGSVVTTQAMTTLQATAIDVTGFPASLVLQPGDKLMKTSGGSYLLVTARVALNGSGAGHVYGIASSTLTWTAADALEVRRPLPSAIQDFFAQGGLIVPVLNSVTTITPAFDVYMRSKPTTGLNLYLVVTARVRGLFPTASMAHQLLLRNWADTSTIETFDWSATYADGYGEAHAADGGWADFSITCQVTDPDALTDWRYKAKLTHTGSSGGFQVMYIGGVSAYWSDEPLGTFRWSYQGGCHRAWDYGNDVLFDRSEPLVAYRVQATERDAAKPFVLGATCDLRDQTIRATPRIVSWKRQLVPGSVEAPLPELELDNRSATLTRQLAAKGSV